MARGELPRWLDAATVARAYATLLDGSLLVRAEQGTAFSRDAAEREAREVLTLVLAAAASDKRPDLPAITPRPFSILSTEERAAVD
jgi:hypothetical protein